MSTQAQTQGDISALEVELDAIREALDANRKEFCWLMDTRRAIMNRLKGELNE